jgi:hypothetical protein
MAGGMDGEISGTGMSPPARTGSLTSWRVNAAILFAASTHASSTSRHSSRARHLLLHLPVSPVPRDAQRRV